MKSSVSRFFSSHHGYIHIPFLELSSEDKSHNHQINVLSLCLKPHFVCMCMLSHVRL